MTTATDASPWSAINGFGYFASDNGIDLTGSTVHGTPATPIASYRTGCTNMVWPAAV